jgi:hypothetical protein
MKMRYNAARAVLELMPVTPDCPQATIALLTSKANTHRSTSDIKVLRRKFTSILPAHFEPVVAGPREWLDAFRPFGPTGINYPGALPEADLGFLRQFERQLVDSGTIRPRVRPQLPSSPLA